MDSSMKKQGKVIHDWRYGHYLCKANHLKDIIIKFFSKADCSHFEIQVKTTCWLNTEFPPGIGKLDGET